MIKHYAQEMIQQTGWVNCWICEDVFRRRRETARYCHNCDRGYCEGEHGSFAHGKGTCVVCGARKDDSPA
jgi:hypothetical protein